MRNIIFMILFMISILVADTVGLTQKKWTSVPTEIYNETEILGSDASENEEVVTLNQDEVAENVTSNGWLEDTNQVIDTEVETIVSSQFIATTKTLEDEIIVTAPIVENREIIEDEIIQNTLADIPVYKAEEVLVNEKVITQEIESNGKAEIIKNSFDIEKESKNVMQFLAPLVIFMQENILLSSLFLTVLALLFFILFRTPSHTVKLDEYGFDDEFEIPQAIMPRENRNSSNPVIQDSSSIINQKQYSILYGLINETFIYEKEKILLATDMVQDRKNRELMALEWKFNQILHFSLPKLSSSNSYHFTEGVNELLDEEYIKDILVVALKDILNIKSITDDDKLSIRKKLKSIEPKRAVA